MKMFRPSLLKMLFPVIGMVAFTGTPAFAQAVTTLKDAQTHLAGQIIYIPKVVAVIAYVVGTFFAATALVKMKDWISEPEKNPINGFLVRMIVAALLIALPKMLYMTNSTLFGFQSNGSSQDNNIPVKTQSLKAF